MPGTAHYRGILLVGHQDQEILRGQSRLPWGCFFIARGGGYAPGLPWMPSAAWGAAGDKIRTGYGRGAIGGGRGIERRYRDGVGQRALTKAR